MNGTLQQTAELAWGNNLRVTVAEGACEPIFGRAAPLLVGAPLAEVLGVSDERARELDAHTRANGRTVEFVSVHRNHDVRTLRLVLERNGEGACANVLDIDAALIGAPPVQISKLSSSLSHELRNPLSSVKMAVQTLAKNTTLGERDQRRLRIANREIRTIERMLSLLSEYGRTTSPSLESVPLRNVLGEAVAMVETELAERDIRFAPVEAPDLPKVRADMARLRPVIAQLLLNIASGLPTGDTLQITLAPAAGGAELVLSDPAAQLPPEERATLFEPFGSRLARGAGLSLAALQRAMTAQGGAVTVEERTGGGTEFRLFFAS